MLHEYLNAIYLCGEGGIRTLGSLLDYGALAKLCFRPLSHLTRFLPLAQTGKHEAQAIAQREAGSIKNH